MTARVTVDGVPNEPVSHREFSAAIAPILALLGDLDPQDLVSLSVNAKEVRAKVTMRNRRGRRSHAGWAHVSRRVDFPVDEEA